MSLRLPDGGCALETSVTGSLITGPALGPSGRMAMDRLSSESTPMEGPPFTKEFTSRRIITEEFIPDGLSLLWHRPLMCGGRS